MKLTEKTIVTEKKTEELLCELTKEEFEQVCAETAAHFVVEMLDDVTDITAGLAMTAMLAAYSAELTKQMFNQDDKSNETDNKEEK